MKTRKIDDELRRWADAHAPGEEQTAELRRRILAEAGTAAPMARLRRRESSWLGQFAWALAGAALAVVAVHLAGLPRQAHPDAPEDGALALARSASVSATGLTEVFAETRRLFPERLRWAADTGRDFVVNVSETTAPGPACFANVGLVAVSRRAGEDWQVLWQVTVMTQDADHVVVALPGGGEATIWAHVADASAAVVETRLALPELAAATSRLLPAGTVELLVEWRTPERELRIYQTAAPLVAPSQA